MKLRITELILTVMMLSVGVDAQDESRLRSESEQPYYYSEELLHAALSKWAPTVTAEEDLHGELQRGKHDPSITLKWTSRSFESEDASSSNYYYYFSNGVSVTRVRWVWNGGSEGNPRVTDFYLRGGTVNIYIYRGAKEASLDLIAGRNAPLVFMQERQLNLDEALIEKGAAEEQLRDLRVLLELLSKEREPLELVK